MAVEQSDMAIIRNKTSNGLTLSVSGSESYFENERVEILIEIRNHGKKRILFGVIDGNRECGIRLHDAQSNPARFTKLGRVSLTQEERILWKEEQQFKKHSRSEAYRRITCYLEPGETHKWRIDLTKLFKLQADQYTLSASVELNLGHPDEFTVQIDDFPIVLK